jgi:hypothetical protein
MKYSYDMNPLILLNIVIIVNPLIIIDKVKMSLLGLKKEKQKKLEFKKIMI